MRKFYTSRLSRVQIEGVQFLFTHYHSKEGYPIIYKLQIDEQQCNNSPLKLINQFSQQQFRFKLTIHYIITINYYKTRITQINSNTTIRSNITIRQQQAMHESTSSSLLRNRRSSSVISEQISKRSSISTCNLNIQSHINNNFQLLQGGKGNGKLILNTNSNNPNSNNINNQIHTNNNHKHIINNPNYKLQPVHSFINRQSQPFITTSSSGINLTLIQQTLIKIKKVTIQVYRPIKKHVKQNILSFSQQQLKQVYQGMSNSLKLIEKLVNVMSMNGQLVSNSINSGVNNINSSGGSNSRERYFECSGSNINVNGNSISMLNNNNNYQHRKSFGDSTIQPLLSHTQQQQHSINNNNTQYYQQLINKLQLQLQTIKTHHSQQIRQMIQTHQQEIGYVEKQHQNQILIIQSNHQKIIQKIKQDNDNDNVEREKQIKQIINQYQAKINFYQEKINLYSQKLQKLTTIQQATRKQLQHQITTLVQNQQKYKIIVKELIQRLYKTKSMFEMIDTQYKEKMKRSMNNIKSSVMSWVKSNSINSRQLLQVILERLTALEKNSEWEGDNNNQNNGNYHNINSNSNSNTNNPTKPHPQLPCRQSLPLQRSTQTISQMFHQNNTQTNSQLMITIGDNIQTVIQRLVYELVMCGFFCQQNEDNVMALFNISKQNKLQYDGIGLDSDSNDGNRCKNAEIGVMGHGLFPLVMEKIKLTISNKYQDLVEQQSNINNNNNAQSSSSKLTSNNVSEFTTSRFNNSRSIHTQPTTTHPYTQHPKPLQQQIYYRNIQRLQQLQVSDSMICDHQQQPLSQQSNNNYIYHNPNQQQQETDQLFRNNSSSDGMKSQHDDECNNSNSYQNNDDSDKGVVSMRREEQLCYGGYESQESGSFDIQLF